ncbi:biotin biosynthesis protein BioC [Aquimixticola soesokkakensis]|uniref:Biotin biosynthesis protein BioC n=1 Tax=Aquimixticola soesokkakensis TaxID=1519096 RepID=A0A1Y5TKN2_9RHOB|nr:methyltransferase domain-containing protein [Aquimixticola soesokkakensis]SLN62620.1 biotin biosynthesis protein BioC [Aquimixticola soesokkakensis]
MTSAKLPASPTRHSVSPDLHGALSHVLDGDATIAPFRAHPLVIGRIPQLKAAYALAGTGHALEFGVFKGESIRALAFAHPERHFVGFDSFSGLPEDWVRSADSTYQAGHFALRALPDVPKNVTLVKGFFEDTLTDWLAQNPGPVSFVHIDCDLYGGCRYALDKLTPRLVDGAVIVFDELCDWAQGGVYPNWEEHEWRALKEWLHETGFCMRILSRDGQFSCAVQVFRTPPSAWTAKQIHAFLSQVRSAGERATALAFFAQDFDATRAPIIITHALATWQLEAGAPKAGLEVLETAISRLDKRTPADVHEMFDLLKIALLVGCDRLEAATEMLTRRLRSSPKNVEALALGAKLAQSRRDYEAAAAYLRKAHHLSGKAEYDKQAQAMAQLATIRPEFRASDFSGLLIQHLVDRRRFETVLDVGSGAGDQARMLRAHGKRVTELDYGESHYFKQATHPSESDILRGDFVTMPIAQTFDCVIASHVLEHQPNVNLFLRKAHAVLREGGVLGLSVPPLKHQIVGGHLTLWNAGLVLYNLVLAGFDCRQPWIRRYGYNISVVIEKKSITPEGLVFDNGDIDRISQYLPEGFGEGFDGNITSHG